MSVISAVLSGFGVTILAELGDKTFFVCALLAAKGNRTEVFIGSYGALIIQTIACILIAVIFSSKARALENQRLRWDLIVGGVCLLFFGALTIYEALTTTTLADEQDMPNLDEMLNNLPNEDPLMLEATTPNTSDVLENMVQKQTASLKGQYVSQDVYVDLDADPVSTADTTWLQANASGWKTRRLSLDSNNPMAMKALSEAATLIQDRTTWTSPTFQAFGAVFAAELGDRSMFSTIALGATANPIGVLAGVLLGHALVTLFAVCCASVVCGYLSQSTASLCAGVLFLWFGAISVWQAASIFLVS